MSVREILLTEVAEHNKETDCWLVLGNSKNGGAKVYDVTKYLNDHPGGPEIIMEFAGKNADEMFEDIGHSNEARTKLKEFFIANLKYDGTEPVESKKKGEDIKSGGGLNPFAVLLLLVAIAVGYYYSQVLKN
jgi:cytochrome b involved in lipid metabolism